MLPGIGVSGWGSCDRGQRGCLTSRRAVPDHPLPVTVHGILFSAFPCVPGARSQSVEAAVLPCCLASLAERLERAMLNRTREEKREQVFLKLVLSGSFFLAAKGAS